MLGNLVTVSNDLKEYLSIKDVIKIIINNVLIYIVSVAWIYLIYYFKLNEKNLVTTIIVSFLIVFLMAILIVII